MSEEDAVAREKAIARANLAKVVTLQKEKKALEEKERQKRIARDEERRVRDKQSTDFL